MSIHIDESCVKHGFLGTVGKWRRTEKNRVRGESGSLSGAGDDPLELLASTCFQNSSEPLCQTGLDPCLKL